MPLSCAKRANFHSQNNLGWVFARLSTAFQQILWKTKLPVFLRGLASVGTDSGLLLAMNFWLLAIFQSEDKLKPRPNFTDGADLNVNQTCRKSNSLHVVE